MKPVRSTFRQLVACTVLGAAVTVSGGCTSLGPLDFVATPPADASRTYPSVETGCTCAAPFAPTRHFERVLIIVLENTDYMEAIDNRYLGDLAKQGVLFTNFHGLFHPSYSNYLAMVSGRSIPTRFDSQVNLQHMCSIGDLLASRGLDWRNYAQGYPEPSALGEYPNHCFTGDSIGRYASKHVPFMSFTSVQNDEGRCSRIVAAALFERGSDTLPAYVFYSPDLDRDGHDTNLDTATDWLRHFLDPLLADRAFMEKTLIVVTFDESRDLSAEAENHIYTVFLGGMVKKGYPVAANYNHFNVLRTIEENFGLCALGDGDGGAKAITGIWTK
jgi:hypothetical protein